LRVAWIIAGENWRSERECRAGEEELEAEEKAKTTRRKSKSLP